MKLILMIGTGSFIGGIFRYLLTQFIQSKFLSNFPFGTLTVNLIGCLLIGFVFGLSEKGNLTPETRMFLATGLLGGFTTFSAFSMESLNLLRDGQFLYAALYIASSVFIGLAAALTGISINKLF